MSKLKKYGAVLLIIMLIIINAVVAFSQVPNTEDAAKHAEGLSKYGANYLIVPILLVLAYVVHHLYKQYNKTVISNDAKDDEQNKALLNAEKEKFEEVIALKEKHLEEFKSMHQKNEEFKQSITNAITSLNQKLESFIEQSKEQNKMLMTLIEKIKT